MLGRQGPTKGRKESFSYRLSGMCGCEVLDPDGRVYAWTVDEYRAAILVGLLNWADMNGLSFDQARPPQFHSLDGTGATDAYELICSSKEDLTLRQEIGELAEKLNKIAEDIAMRVSKA